MFFGLIFGVAILIGILLTVVWVARGFSGGIGGGFDSPAVQSPREVVQLRYARGEITRDQYQKMLQDLG